MSDRAELLTTWVITEIERALQGHGVKVTGSVAAALSAAYANCRHLIHGEIADAQREARDEVWQRVDIEDYSETAAGR
jgi:hypothetical protein